MPNHSFCSFIASYRNAVISKKIKFGVKLNTLNINCLKILLNDGYIWTFFCWNKKIHVIMPDLDISLYFNWIVVYSTSWKIIKLNFNDLIKLTHTGGYFIISTPQGVLNDSDAWKLKIGGILLMGIF